MSWQNEMVLILRHLVDDLDESTYDSPRLEETVLIAAHLIQHDVDFNQTYTIDIDGPALTPDPTSSPRDVGFINLACKKAACIILQAEARTKSKQAIKVVDGPSTIDMTKIGDAALKAAQDACKSYEEARVQYQIGQGKVGQAVTGPITDTSVIPYRGHWSNQH